MRALRREHALHATMAFSQNPAVDTHLSAVLPWKAGRLKTLSTGILESMRATWLPLTVAGLLATCATLCLAGPVPCESIAVADSSSTSTYSNKVAQV